MALLFRALKWHNVYKLLVIFTFSFFLNAGLAVAQDKQALTEKQLRELSSKISGLQKSMRAQEGESKQLSKALRESEIKIGKLARQIQALDKQLSGLGSRAENLEDKRDALRKELKQRASLIEQQVAQQYQMGTQARLQLLLTQKDPEQIDRQIRYFDFVNEALQQDMRLFREKLKDLSGTERDLSDTEQAMVNKRAALKKEVAALRGTRDIREKTLASLRTAISSDGARLKQLQLDQKRLQTLLEEIESSLNFATIVTDKAFTTLKGKLPWPLKGKIRQSFGTISNGVQYDGIWIDAAESAPVKAVHHGRVVFADWLRGYGLVLIVDHGSGYMSLYGYNQSLLHDIGDWVSTGDEIATAGNSGGRSTKWIIFCG